MEPKDEIKGKLDIVDVVGESIELKPAGSGNFRGLCPFHGEKTPSFYVSREKDIWHCFGCDKGGDIFSFVMEFEGMSFPEAMRYLGKKAGVEVPEFRPEPAFDNKRVLFALHEAAVTFYETSLHQHSEGSQARDYLKIRGIASELARQFRLGYASDRWDGLVTHLMSQGFKEVDIVAAGLGKQRSTGTGVIDRFRGRLMIPLCDPTGNVLGFTGRLLTPQEHAPKYLNSPETAIYHKSDVLFGLNLAKNAIRTHKAVIIVEGNLDVVASHKAGVANVVASSGTALTESQLRQLKKVTSKLVFSFDADDAGFEAAKRGIRLAQVMDFDIRVIQIPKEDGKDPDDVVQKDPECWKALSEHPVHVMQYFYARGLAKFDVGELEGKKQFAHFLLEEINRLPDTLEQEHWLQTLSDVVHVEMEVLRKMVVRPQFAPKEPPAGTRVPNAVPAHNITSQSEQAVSFLLGTALADDMYVDLVLSELKEADIPKNWSPIYKTLQLLYNQNKSADTTQNTFFSRFQDHFSTHGSEDDLKRLNASVIRAQEVIGELSKEQVRQEISRHLQLLASKSHDAKRKQLEAAIRQAETSGDNDRLKALIEEYTKLIS